MNISHDAERKTLDFQGLYEAERLRAAELERALDDARKLIENLTQAEAATRQQRDTLETVLSHTADFSYIFDLQGRFLYINRALLSLWQKPLEEAVGKNFFDLEYPPILAEKLQRQIQEVISTKGIVRDTTPYTGADGNPGEYEYIFVPVFDNNGSVSAVVGSTRDITPLKRIEEALRDSEARLDQVFQQAPVPIVVFRGRNFVVELANPFYRALIKGRDLIGHPFGEVVPELGQDVWDALNHVFDTGEPFLADEWLVPYDQNGDGIIEDVWFNVVYQPLRGIDQMVSGVIAVCSDVSAQVRARRGLERINRDLEEFAYVASHDLQEPLRMVNIYSELLLESLGPSKSADLQQYADFVSGGVRKMEALIRDLLEYSKAPHAITENADSTADLGAALAHALGLLKSRIEENQAEVNSGALPVVAGNEGQLAHVFQNLISNALKYRNPSVTPHIRVRAQQQGNQWVVMVQDNGIGFEQNQADRIFGLFKRLHDNQSYPGTGIGLAICKRIIEAHGGRMWAESVKGSGSKFLFALPAVRAAN